MPTWEIERNGKVIGEIESERPPTRKEVLRAMTALDRQSVLPPMPRAPEPPPQRTIGNHAVDAASSWWDVANPMNIVHAVNQAVLPEPVGKMFGYEQSGPLNTMNAVTNQVVGGVGKAIQEPQYAVSHLMNAVPVVGPLSNKAGQQLERGEYGGAAGTVAGVATAALAPQMGKAAASLERGAQRRVADVMSPKVGRQKQRFGNRAERIAPEMTKDLAADGAPLSREAFHGQIGEKYAGAKQSLDAAADARLAARSFETQPLIDGLLKKRAALVAEAPDATGISYQQITVKGKPATTWIKNRGPLGEDVVPAPNRARVAQIDEAIRELRQLGPVSAYEPIRRIRQAFDGPAEVVYNPSVTQDFLTAQGSKLGAADVTSVLRENLAKWDPETAAANTQYSLYKGAKDLMDAVAEVERTRPRVGRQIMARLTGSMIGGQGAGVPGAIAGYAAGPLVESALASGVTTQLKTAALMQNLADAIRSGNIGQVDRLTRQLRPGLSGLAGRGSVGAPVPAAADQEPER